MIGPENSRYHLNQSDTNLTPIPTWSPAFSRPRASCLFLLWILVMMLTLNPLEWLASNFSLPHHPWIKLKGQENKVADHRLKKLLIVTQILQVGILGNVQRTVWRICILMLGSKGLTLVKLFSVFTLKDGEIDLKLLTNVLSPETEVFEVGHNSFHAASL